MSTTILQDPFGRIHDYLRISLTEKCNLRCSYCMPEAGVQLSPRDSILSAQEIYDITKIFIGLGINKIRLTGGEPLIRKDFKDIIKSLSNLPIKLTMTTNALLVDKFIDDLKKCGITSLNVSLDTLNADKFQQITKRDRFQQTINNINLLIKNGFHVKINVVLMKDFNEDEILDFVKWTKKDNIHIRFIEFMPFDGNNWEWNKIISLKEILDTIDSHYKIIKLLDGKNATAKAYQVLGYKGTFAVISSMTNHFCGSCNRLRLTANGKMKNCLFSNNEVDLLTPFRNGKNITPLIQNCLSDKKVRHGGINELSKLNADSPMMSERSMITIGG
ncbi:MAG: GTP 3',8-cyclase MoaA [Bacteroidia bacterium]|nr:GTP 3',8-cyclase MoaA [Bacteroidia bacterium]